MNYAVFGKIMQNARKNRDIKLVTIEARTNYLVSESNYHTSNVFSENFLAIEIKRTQILMNKPVYLGLSILEVSKIVVYEFWYGYVKPKYCGKAKLCYMDTDNFIVYKKTEDIYSDIAKEVEIRFDTSNYELDRPSPKVKNKKVIGLMKDELRRKIMTEFATLKIKTYSYSTDGKDEDKRTKGTEKCAIKRKLKFKEYKHCLEATHLENKINQPAKNKLNVYSVQENHKELIKNNKLILKSQQRLEVKSMFLLKKLIRLH